MFSEYTTWEALSLAENEIGQSFMEGLLEDKEGNSMQMERCYGA